MANVNVRLITHEMRSPAREMVQRQDVLTNIEMMQESLRETMRETTMLRRVAIEEEVLIGAENIDKTCANALRYARLVRSLVSGTQTRHRRRHR